MKQMRIEGEACGEVKLSELYEIIQSYRTPKYTLGYDEKYEITRDRRGRFIQINVYRRDAMDKGEKIIKKGVYLCNIGNDLYVISFFSSECLPGMVNYDTGIVAGGGRGPEAESTKFLRWFVNQTPIYDDLQEVYYD